MLSQRDILLQPAKFSDVIFVKDGTLHFRKKQKTLVTSKVTSTVGFTKSLWSSNMRVYIAFILFPVKFLKYESFGHKSNLEAYITNSYSLRHYPINILRNASRRQSFSMIPSPT